MKVTINPPQWCGSPSVKDLAEYIAGKLDSNSYDNGRIEDMSDSLDRLREAFGRLVETLVDEKTICLPAVSTIIGAGDELSEAP